MPIKTVLIVLSSTLLAAPAGAVGDELEPLVEPAVKAQWLNNAEVERIFVRETKGFSRFEARPAMKIGLMVEPDGTVTECLPLALEEGGPAYGAELCPTIVAHARFEPARDVDGNAIRSIYIAYFKEFRPGSAAENRDFG